MTFATTDDEGSPPTAALAADVEAAFKAAVEQLESSIAAERDDARRSVELLGSRKLEAAAKDVPGASEQLESALAGARERLEEVEILERYRRTLATRGS